MTESRKHEIVEYSPAAEIRTPAKLLGAMLRDLTASRELAWRLFVRDLSARYRQSVFGVFWAFAPAILTGLVFVVLESKMIFNVPATDVPYPAFALTGAILWSVFAESVGAPLRTIQCARPLLAKINFPREALILSAFYDQLFNVVIKLMALVAVLVTLKFPLEIRFLLAIPASIMLVLLGMTIGLLLTPAGMLYSDVGSVLAAALQLWFFITPVVYPPPQGFPYSLLVTLNPVSPLLVGARDIALNGTLSDPWLFFSVGGLTLAFLAVAWVLFRISIPIIIERVSS